MMSRRTCQRSRLAAAMLAAVSMTSCAKKMSEARAPEALSNADINPEDLDALMAALSDREDRLRQFGVAPAASPAATGAITGATADASDDAELGGGDANAIEDGASLDGLDASARDRGFTSAVEEAPAASEPIELEAADDASSERVSRAREPHRVVTRCQQVCEISSSICDLEASICALSDRHPNQERYQSACKRAQGDCDIAEKACNECS